MNVSSTNKETSKKLAAYSAMAGVFVLTSAGLRAEVIYTDVDPDETYDSDGDFYEIDLNNDGDVDFKIGIVDFVYPGFFYTTGTAGYTFDGIVNAVMAYPYNGAIAAYTTAGYAFAYAMNDGNNIDDGLSFQTNSQMFMTYYLAVVDYPASGSIYPFLTIGEWAGAEDKYLGLRLEVDGDDYYGWARLDVPDSHHEFTIKDYAFQSNAEQSIDAGQIVSVHNVIQSNELTAYSYNNMINIVVKDLKTTGATVKVFNINGQAVFTDGLDLTGMNITMNNVATGTYTLQVITKENSVFTKQLYIQN